MGHSTKYVTSILKSVKVMKEKGTLTNSHRSEETRRP